MSTYIHTGGTQYGTSLPKREHAQDRSWLFLGGAMKTLPFPKAQTNLISLSLRWGMKSFRGNCGWMLLLDFIVYTPLKRDSRVCSFSPVSSSADPFHFNKKAKRADHVCGQLETGRFSFFLQAVASSQSLGPLLLEWQLVWWMAPLADAPAAWVDAPWQQWGCLLDGVQRFHKVFPSCRAARGALWLSIP